jgi:pimeloyl-ACP methyl ester carboxylesterase
LPKARYYNTRHVSFRYRIFSDFKREDVEKVYIIQGGFAERAGALDTGIKGLITDMLAREVDTSKYAIVCVGGIFSFGLDVRSNHVKSGHGVLREAADEIATFIKKTFCSIDSVSVAGYSMGGVLAPLTAQAILKRRIARIDQVCTGEPSYYPESTTRLHLLKRFTRSSSFRNDQISASHLDFYIQSKKAPSNIISKTWYRLLIYQPLFWNIWSMRLVIWDLALQGLAYESATSSVQFKEALHYLASHHVAINMLNAENSVVCDASSFSKLVADLSQVSNKIFHITVTGSHADHGIEEQRTLTTPFLVQPELYNSVP